MKAPAIGLLGSIVGEILASHLHSADDGRSAASADTLIAQLRDMVQAGRSHVAERLRERLQLPGAGEVERLHDQVKALEEELATLRAELSANRSHRAQGAARARQKKTATVSEGDASATGTGSARRARTRGKGNRT